MNETIEPVDVTDFESLLKVILERSGIQEGTPLMIERGTAVARADMSRGAFHVDSAGE